MPTTTYWRARSIWQARTSEDTDLASRAKELISKIDSGEIALSTATKALGLEPKYPTRPQILTTQAIRRIASTLETLQQVMSGIKSPKSIDTTEDEATELAEQITNSCKAIARSASKLRRKK